MISRQRAWGVPIALFVDRKSGELLVDRAVNRRIAEAITAEGVETMDQLDWLRAEGCNEVQGFLFSPARPADEIQRLLSKFGARASQAA